MSGSKQYSRRIFCVHCSREPRDRSAELQFGEFGVMRARLWSQTRPQRAGMCGGAAAVASHTYVFRVCSKINSDFAGGCLAVWLGASDEHTRQRSVRSEQRRQTAKQPQPFGAGRRLAICFVARRSQPTGGDAPSSRLASGQAALPPKSEVIFEQTLSAVVGTARCAVRAPYEGRN